MLWILEVPPFPSHIPTYHARTLSQISWKVPPGIPDLILFPEEAVRMTVPFELNLLQVLKAEGILGAQDAG